MRFRKKQKRQTFRTKSQALRHERTLKKAGYKKARVDHHLGVNSGRIDYYFVVKGKKFKK